MQRHPDAKPLRQSKTFWLNVTTVISVSLGAVAVGIRDLPISEDAVVWVLFVVGVIQPALNVVLRLRTHDPIAGSTGERMAIHDDEKAVRFHEDA